MVNNGSNDEKTPMIPKMPNRKYGYFRDDQVSFLVTHPEPGLSPDVLEVFRKEINPVLELHKAGSMEQTPKAVSFPALTSDEYDQARYQVTKVNQITVRGAFSIITGLLQNGLRNPQDFLTAIRAVQEDLAKRPKDGQLSNGIVVEGVSLNWLTSVVSQGAGTGGPGGIPSPYYGSRKNAPYTFDLVRKLQDDHLWGDGDGADVVILDTAPSAHDLVAAYKEWPDHPLIQTLLGPKGKLHLYPANYDETLRLGNTSLNGSDYKMTDHGLFIAGIIHSIVPRAEIHLIEVLNQYGVGDFQSLAEGLQTAYTNFVKRGRQLFVNCSWMLDLPADQHHCHYQPANPNQVLADPDLEFERQVRLFAENDGAFLSSMETLFARFAAPGRGAIAAAGNDAYDDDEKKTGPKHIRPKARYPAALSSVAGVGALPVTLERDSSGKYRTSAFSNRSDRPEKIGITTLGGEQGDGKGILGLYIGDFPDGRLNTSKWAWWAGTSFATPILTGVLASLASGPLQINTRVDAVSKLREKRFLDGITELSEIVLATTQC
jgi:hypothetical protein